VAKDKDVFGFDELTKSFQKMEKKYPNAADAMLAAQGRAVTNKTKSLSPVGKTKKLKGSWRLKGVKQYKGGKVRVVRVQSEAPHAHLVEQGHEVVRGGSTRRNGRKLNTVQRAVRGIKSGGRVEGKKMLEQSIKEAQARFDKDAAKLLNDLTREVEL
jgi:hypothetical protein